MFYAVANSMEYMLCITTVLPLIEVVFGAAAVYEGGRLTLTINTLRCWCCNFMGIDEKSKDFSGKDAFDNHLSELLKTITFLKTKSFCFIE